jgi:GalNAc-alpha-(1->4)-GalNAc-alpha-(1->3)-diNAcBac-PP-undecaprenol alpha-1,4-N-acetyl-D-galactosaminyltransferase
MKLVFVISSLEGGGAERVQSELANNWDNKGVNVVLVVLAGGNSKIAYRLNPSIRIVFLKMLKDTGWIGSKVSENVRRIRKLRARILDEEPDGVISFMTSSNILVILATRLTGILTIVSERSNPRDDVSCVGFWRVLRRFTYRYANSVVVQTEEAGRWLNRECGLESKVIPNPIRDLPTLDLKRKETILSFGRLDTWRSKGFDLLIQVFGSLTEKFPDWHLIIVGSVMDFGRKNEIDMLIKDLNLKNKVEFVGWVENVEEWMAEAGIVVQFSRFEGFPNVVLEALGMGAAVISSKCTGAKELIVDRRSGRLVNVEDVGSLERILAELMCDQKERERLGEEAREVRHRFRVSKIVKSWEELLSPEFPVSR